MFIFLLNFVLFFFSNQSLGQDWDTPYEKCDTPTTTCYTLYTQESTWLTALQSCPDLNDKSKLLSIETDAKYRVVNQIIRDSKMRPNGFWVAATDSFKEGTWVWSTNGKSIRSSLWSNLNGIQEPNGDGNCGMLWSKSSYKLGDTDCNYRIPFICERPSP